MYATRLFIASLILETDLLHTQQSRFLALVGNYDEYAKALEVAANAEDAGTLQYLKTMDSIETKLQQVKTAWTQLYSSMGLEKLFKGALDTTSKILQNFNKIGTANGLISLFTILKGLKSLINVIFNFASSNINKISEELRTNLSKATNAKIILEYEEAYRIVENLGKKLRNEVNAEVKVDSNGNTTLTRIAQNNNGVRDSLLSKLSGIRRTDYYKQRADDNQDLSQIDQLDPSKIGAGTLSTQLNLTADEIAEYGKLFKENGLDQIKSGEELVIALEKIASKTNSAGQKIESAFNSVENNTISGFNKLTGFVGKHARAIGMALDIAGSALTTFAMTIEDSSKSNVEKSKLASGGGNILSALGTGLTTGIKFGPIIGLLAAAPQLISGIAQMIDGSVITTSERIEMLTGELEDLKNEATIKKGTANDLKTVLNELNELADAQYDSAEASQAYKDKMNEIAEKYPELVESYNSVGDATIDMTELEKKLAEARANTAQATLEAAKTEYQIKEQEAKQAKEKLDEIEIGNPFGTQNYNNFYTYSLRKNSQAFSTKPIDKDFYGIFNEEEIGTLLDGTYALTKSGAEEINRLISIFKGEIEGTLNYIDLLKLQASGAIERINFSSDFDLSNFKLEDLYNSDIENYIYSKTDELLSYYGESIEEVLGENYSLKELYDTFNAYYLKLKGEVDKTKESQKKYSEYLSKKDIEADFAEKASVEYDTELGTILTDYSSGLSSLAIEIVKNSLNVDSLDEVDETILQQEQDKVTEAIYSWLETVDEETVSQFMEIWDNAGSYQDSGEIAEAVNALTNDSVIVDGVISHYSQTVDSIRERFNKAILKISDDTGIDDFSSFDVLFDDDKEKGELISDYIDGLINTFNQISTYYNKGLKNAGASLLGNAYDLYGAISDLDGTIQADLFPFFKTLDLTDADSIQNTIDQLEKYIKYNPNSGLKTVLEELEEAKNTLAFNLTIQIENWKDEIISSSEKIKETVNNQTSGMDITDALKSFQSLTSLEGNENLTFDELFRFDEELNKWIYTQEGFNKAMDSVRADLEKNSAETKGKLDLYKNNLDYGAIFEINKLYSSGAFFNENGELDTEQLKKILNSFGIIDENFISTLENDLMSYNPEEDGSLTYYLLNLIESYSNSAKQAIKMTNAVSESIISSYVNSLDFSKLGAGIISDRDKELLQSIFEELGISWEEAFSRIESGASDILTELDGQITAEQKSAYIQGKLNAYSTALNDLMSKPGTILSETTREIFKSNDKYSALIAEDGVTLADNATLIGEALLDYYNELKNTTGATLEQINSVAEEMISRNFGMESTSSTLGLLSYDISLGDLKSFADANFSYLERFFNDTFTGINDEFANVLEYNSGTQSFNVIDFNGFISQLENSFGVTINKSSKEYLDAYSSYAEGKIEADSHYINSTMDEIQSLLDAKIGDKVAIPYLQSIISNLADFKFTIKDGYVDLTGQEDILALIEEISNIETEGNSQLNTALIELKDSILSLLNGYTDIISSGIEGSMSYSNLNKLQAFLGDRAKIQTTKTENGLQLTQQSVFEIYQALLEIDSLSARVVLNNLAESAVNSEEKLNDIYYIMEKITKLNQELATAKPGTDRETQLKAELALTKQIRDNLLEAGDSFNFMGRNVPTSFTNPLSAWEGMGDAFEILDSDDFKKGQIGFQDFYNMITMMGDDVLRSAGIFTDDSQTAADLIKAGVAALTNIDGETFVDLSKIGANFNLGAEGMKEGLTDGIHTLAENQIDMIDAEISLLETVVKSQNIFNSLDTDKSGELDLSEFTPEFTWDVDENGNKVKVYSWGEGEKELLQTMQDYLGDIEIAGKSLSDYISNPENFVGLTDEEKQTVISYINGFIEVLNSDDWTGDIGKNGQLLQDRINSYLEKLGIDTRVIIDPSKLAENITFEKAESGSYVPEKVEEKLKELIGESNWSSMGDEVTQDLVDKVTEALNNGQQLSPEDLLQEFIPEGFREQVTAWFNKNLTVTSVDAKVGINRVIYATPDGQSFESYEAALAHAQKNGYSQEQILPYNINAEIVVNGDKTAVYKGIIYGSLDEALEQFYSDKGLEAPKTETYSATADIQITPANITIQTEGENGELQASDLTTVKANVSELVLNPTGTAKLADDSTVTLIDTEGISSATAKVEILDEAISDLSTTIEEVDGSTVNVTVNKTENSSGENTTTNVTNNVVNESYSVDTSGVTTALTSLGTAFSTLQSQINSLKTELDNVPDKSNNIKKTADEMNKLPDRSRNVRNTALAMTALKDKSKAVQNTANAIDNLKSKTISAVIKVTINAPNKAETSTSTKLFELKSKAKGNVALAKGKTLMGELGRELIVSGGHYYTVGENGAEFVDLPKDAIVFNHLQTEKLLGNGKISSTGRAVTNEKNATSMATGNAMASASDALAQLYELRAMWEALLDASASDLGKKAGSGGGGGGGGGGGSGEETLAYIHDLERWYNLLRQIEKYEEQINYQQTKRQNILSGYDYVGSLEKELEILKKQRKAYQDLSSLQKDYYDKRRQDLLSTDYSLIFTYDEEGLMQYVDGMNRGLDILAKLNETDTYGRATKNATQQLQYLKSVGFDISQLERNAEGTQAEKDEDRIQNFWDGVDNWMAELDDLFDSYNEATTNMEEATNKINEILQEYIDNQLEVEKKLLQAIEDRQQAEINRITDEKEALEDAAKAYIDGLSDALEKERNMYSKNETEQETAKLQRQLAILQRSSGSASEIRALQDQIDSRLKDSYFEKQQEQIDAIQEASDNQINKLQEQIDLMTETLEYQKENGLLWQEVYDMMNNWTPEKMLQFIEEYTQTYKENSALQNQEDSKQALKELEIWASKRDNDASEQAWENYYNNLTGISEDIKKSYAEEAKSAFKNAYTSSGAEGAKIAADSIYSNAQSAIDSAKKEDEKNSAISGGAEIPAQPNNETSTASIKETLKNGNVYLRKTAGTGGTSLGLIKKGTSVEISGMSKDKKDGYYWFKAKANGKNGYMAYTNHWGSISKDDLDKLPKFKEGGLIDFTGPAWVDGSKRKPESILSAEDTAMLKSKIFGNSNSSIKALVMAIESINKGTEKYSSIDSSGEQIIIEHAEVSIQPGVISNDYEAKRAGEMALEQMVKIARKTGKQSVRR